VPPKKRRKPAPSIRVGCLAGLSVKKLKGKDSITVVWHWKHKGHDPLDISSIQESRLLASVKEWIKDRVAEGRDWISIHDLLRVDPDTLDQLGTNSTKIPAALAVSRMDIYNVLRRSLIKNSQLRSGCIASLEAWAKQIILEGGWANVATEVFDYKTNGNSGWYMSFATRWQRDALARYGQRIVCMDSTHNTCTGIKVSESVYLYTVLARNQVTGRGVPLAFMLTNAENQIPITNFLKELQREGSFNPEFIMIDCSETEAAAVKMP